MFCTKCGKKIDYEASVCNECAGVGQWFNADAQPAPEVKVEAEQEINVNNDFNNAANQNANNGFYTAPNTNPYANQNYNTQYNQGYDNSYNQSYNTTYTQGYTNTYAPAPEKPKGSRKAGLKGAITAAVLSTLGFSFSYAAELVVTEATLISDSDVAMISAIVGIPFAIAGLIMSIIGLVKGAASIKVFKASSPKPIATLILGIESVCTGAGGIMMTLAFFMMALGSTLLNIGGL